MRFLLILYGVAFAGVGSATADPLPVMQFSLPASDGYTPQVKTEGTRRLSLLPA